MKTRLILMFMLLIMSVAANAAAIEWTSVQYLLNPDDIQLHPGSQPLPALTHKFPNGKEERITSVINIAAVPDGPVLAAALCELPGGSTILEFDGANWKARAWNGPYKVPAEENYLEYNSGGVSIEVDGKHRALIAASRRCGPPDKPLFPFLEAGIRWAMLDAPRLLEFPADILSVAAASGASGAVGTPTGLYLLEIGKEPKLALPEIEGKPLSLKEVGALFYDVSDRLWAGCDQGVLMFDGASWKLDEPAATFSSSMFTCAAADSDGTMWFGTDKGAYRREDTDWRHFSGPQWLPCDHVKDIAFQSNGAVWLATTAGIGRLTPAP